jgi:hypothetical protein
MVKSPRNAIKLNSPTINLNELTVERRLPTHSNCV